MTSEVAGYQTWGGRGSGSAEGEGVSGGKLDVGGVLPRIRDSKPDAKGRVLIPARGYTHYRFIYVSAYIFIYAATVFFYSCVLKVRW